MAQLQHASPVQAEPLRQAQGERDASETNRQAYNIAFEELGLNWYWDAATFAKVSAHGRDGVRKYLQDEHPHLLRAYEADFLVDAIEATKTRHAVVSAAQRPADTPVVH